MTKKVTLVIVSLTLALLTLMTPSIARADSVNDAANTMPVNSTDVNAWMKWVNSIGCLDQHIVTTNGDSSKKVDQKVGNCAATSSNDANQSEQKCLDQHIVTHDGDSSKQVDQKLCGTGAVLAATPTPTVTQPVVTQPATTATPVTATPTELPSTGPGTTVALSLVGIVGALLTKRYLAFR